MSREKSATVGEKDETWRLDGERTCLYQNIAMLDGLIIPLKEVWMFYSVDIPSDM